MKIKYHFVFWTTFITYEVATIYFMGLGFAPVLDYLMHYILNICLFYANAYLVFRFAYNKKSAIIKATCCGSLLIVLYLFLKYLLNSLYISYSIQTNDQLTNIPHFLNASVWRALYFLGLSTTYIFIVSTLLNSKQIANLQLQQLQTKLFQQKLEQDLIASENAFLKAQINPHFVFNSLNFIQNFVADYSEKGSELIIHLAEIMRYAFAEPTQDGKVDLSAEVEQLHNYLHLNQQRFNDQLYLDFKTKGDTKSIRIIPLVLISILENMFKYGDLTNTHNPAKFYLEINNECISLLVKNEKAKRTHTSSSGIGMSNIRKRLNQHYADQYTLIIDQNAQQYNLNLTIAIPVYDLLYN